MPVTEHLRPHDPPEPDPLPLSERDRDRIGIAVDRAREALMTLIVGLALHHRDTEAKRIFAFRSWLEDMGKTISSGKG